MDESVSPALQLYVVVSNTDGSVNYADYSATVIPGTNSFSATFSAAVDNAEPWTEVTGTT